MSAEIRVYGIKPDTAYSTLDLGTRGLLDISNEEWINEAEAQGQIWSLYGFQDQFNCDQIDQQDLFIRII
jgi:hypothetical protein